MASSDNHVLRSRYPFALSRTLVALAIATAMGCSDNTTSTGGTGGTGGKTGSGGSATGGSSSAGTGGAGTGGSNGTGGKTSNGGASGSGGAGAGGATGSGGTTAQGTGGAAAGGASGSGGNTTGAGGKQGSGGQGAGGAAGSADASTDGRPDVGTDTGGSTTFNPCPAGSSCKIMPLGDSITEGFGASGADGGGPANQGGYRIELFRQSVKNSKDVTFVGNLTNGPTTVESKSFPKKHEGHGGWTISQIAGIADSSLSTNKPNIVLLKIGTNDVNGGGSSGAPTGLKNLIDQITKDVPSALLVVSSIIPIKDDGTNGRVKTYNATIPTAVKAAADAGKHVIFADAYAAFVADSNWKTKYMSDNLHPNDTGYQLLGQTWYAAISAVLPAAQ